MKLKNPMLVVTDIDKSIEFYKKVFGLHVIMDFDSFFTLFHQVLFAGDDTWLFNPNTDSVIYILPEAFFLHCFLLFLILYEVSFCSLLWQIRRKNKENRGSTEETNRF